MQPVLCRRPVGATRPVDAVGVIGGAEGSVFAQGQVNGPEESLPLKVEGQDAVMPGGSQVQVIVQLVDFVAVLQVSAAERALNVEFPVIDEQLIAGGDIGLSREKRNAPQAPVPATALPINVGGVPVHHLAHFLPGEIDQVHAAVAFALL